MDLFDDKVVKLVLEYPGVKEKLDIDSIEDDQVKQAFSKRL